jgi:hypothetical protein
MEMLSAIEASLVRELHPICNQQMPTAAPLLVDLPPLTVANTFTSEEMSNDEEPS